MPQDFLTRLSKAPILCDGAMGTLLYSKGIFINRSYDELNLSQPDLIRSVHQDYLHAGAEIIETKLLGRTASGWAGTAWPTRFVKSTWPEYTWPVKLPKASMSMSLVRLARWEFRLNLSAKHRSRKHARRFANRLPRWLRAASIS